MNESEAAQIKAQAEEIRKVVAAGLLYGHPVDMNDLDQVVLAAWLAGREYAMAVTHQGVYLVGEPVVVELRGKTKWQRVEIVP